ncbi:MAG: hypothetical protein ACP5JG_02900 [Anaerolineae bacterium]
MTRDTKSPVPKDRVFNPGKADWVQEEGSDRLDPDQKALLLAFTQLEAELGCGLSEKEVAAVQTLTDEIQGFDPQEIKAAVHQMVTEPADPERKVSWPDLKLSHR